MANQTVSVDRNLDDAAISGLLNGETVTINTNATFTVNSDNRWSQQAAVLGGVTIDAVTGGKFKIDGTEVWWIPFDAGAGVVPALPTLGTNDVLVGATPVGEFLGIWSSMPSAPLAASAAMPATGWIKLRRKVSAIADNDVLLLTGGASVTVNSTTGGQRGWLNVSGTYQGTITLPRLGTFESIGDFFVLGTTNGANNQTFAIPFMDCINNIEIETAPGSGVYDKWFNAGTRWTSATATFATDLRGKVFGQQLDTITATTSVGSAVIPTATTTGIVVGMPVTASANFTVTSRLYVTAVNPGVSFTVSENATVAASTTFTIFAGVITLGKSAAPAQGFVPPSGCLVRIPNIALSTASTLFVGNCSLATIADQYEFATTTSGSIVMEKAMCSWYINCSAAYGISLKYVFFNRSIVLANIATAMTIEHCANGYGFSTAASALAITNCYSGGTIVNSLFVRYSASAAGDTCVSLTDCAAFTITNSVFALGSASSILTTRGNADTRSLILTRCFDTTMTGAVLITGQLSLTSCVNCNILNTVVCDTYIGTTSSTNPLTAAINLNSASSNIKISGYDNLAGVTNVHTYSAWIILATGCANIDILNIGTEAAPINCGSSNATGLLVTASVTVGLTMRRLFATLTRTAALSLANTVQNIICDCVKGDYADAQAIAGVSIVVRGARWTNSVTGQTAVYGAHWEDAFTAATTGRLVLKCNEPLAGTASQCSVTAGAPKFTSTGNIAMPTIGDQVTWTMPYMAIGHKSFANIAPTLTGTLTANMTMEYQIDTGSGFSAWKALSAANLFAETIPAYVNVYSMGGFKLKIRATTNTANTTNALTYVRIDTVTDATEQTRQYALRTPTVGYSGVVNTSIMDILSDSGDYLAAGPITAVAGTTLSTPPWNSDYTAIARLRKCGYAPIEDTITVVETGALLTASQTDWSTVPETNPGALGITVTNHGAAPVSWNSKSFSITITTTNDALTASQVANYIHWNIAQQANLSAIPGMYWPTMIEPDDVEFKTIRGRLFTSVGATLKGVRIVRSDGATAHPGFTKMMADDGTYYIRPTVLTISIPNALSGSRVWLYNATTDTVIENIVLGGIGYTYTTFDGINISNGDAIEVRVNKIGYINLPLTATSAATGVTFSNTQVVDGTYTALGINGATVTGVVYTIDAVSSGVDALDLDVVDDSIQAQELYAWLSYYSSTSQGIARSQFYWSPIDTANYTVPDWLKVRNVKVAPTVATTVTDAYLQSQTPSVSWIASNWLQSVQGRGFLAGGEALTQTLTYSGFVNLELDSVYSGVSFPVGTVATPVNNLADAIAIALSRGIHTITIGQNLVGSTIVAITQDVIGYQMQRASGTAIVVAVNSTYSVERTTFQEVIVTGTIKAVGEFATRTCRLLNLLNIAGVFIETQLSGACSLRNSTNGSTFSRCGTLGTVTLDCQSDAAIVAVFSEFSGDVTINNLVAGAVLIFDAVSAKITIGASCTGGTVIVRGNVQIVRTGTVSLVYSDYVGATEVVSGWSRDRILRKLAALAVSKTSGNTGGAGTTVFRTLDDTANEFSATVDANGNRTAVTAGP